MNFSTMWGDGMYDVYHDMDANGSGNEFGYTGQKGAARAMKPE